MQSPHPLHSSTSMVTLPRAGPDMFFTSSRRSGLNRLRHLQPLGFLAVLVQLRAEVGMRDLDQRLGALADGLAMQKRDAEFGDDVADKAARCDHSRPRVEHGYDSRNCSILGRRRHRDDGLAAFGTRGAPQEIHLPTNAAVKLIANRIRTN